MARKYIRVKMKLKDIISKAVKPVCDSASIKTKKCEYLQGNRCLKNPYPFMDELRENGKKIHLRKKDLNNSNMHKCYQHKCDFVNK